MAVNSPDEANWISLSFASAKSSELKISLNDFISAETSVSPKSPRIDLIKYDAAFFRLSSSALPYISRAIESIIADTFSSASSTKSSSSKINPSLICSLIDFIESEYFLSEA